MYNQNCNATISVLRVLDSCKKQLNLAHAELELRAIPKSAVAPYHFISAHSSGYNAIITNLTVTPLEKCDRARVKCNVTIPLNVILTDARGVKFNAKSKITIPEDIVLYAPAESVFPYEIKANASCNCPSGTVTGTTADCNACITIITKVVTEADLVVPCYGYGQVPNAHDFEHNACEDFFKLPLYPTGK